MAELDQGEVVRRQLGQRAYRGAESRKLLSVNEAKQRLGGQASQRFPQNHL